MSTIAERHQRRKRYSQTGTLDDRRTYRQIAAQELSRNRQRESLGREVVRLVKNCSQALRERDQSRGDLRQLAAKYAESAKLAPFYVRVTECDTARRSQMYCLSVTFSLNEIAMQLYRGSREGWVDQELRAIACDVEHKVYRALAEKVHEYLGVPKGASP